MKKSTLLLATLALSLGGLASAQNVKFSAPDSIVLDVGVTTPQALYLGGHYVRPALNLYGNLTVGQTLKTTSNGTLYGTLKVGNDYNDLNRLFVEGKLDYGVRNVTLYAAVKQGFYSRDGGLGNEGTSVRIGTQVRF